ncbi:MAG: hypothetical protein ACFFB3_00910, partial [Candidatus Hodarchaeota archaeon]
MGKASNPTCLCGSSRLRKVGELSAYALQGIFDLQRTLESAVFIPLRQYNQWTQLKKDLSAYSPIFEVQTPESSKSLSHITSAMRFVLSNLNDYSTKLRKLFMDVTAASNFAPEDFQRFQEDLEFTNQDISFFCERIEDKASRVTPLLDALQEFAEELLKQQDLLGNIHNELFLNPPEKICWVSDVGKCEVNGRSFSAHIVVTTTRIIVLSCGERNVILEITSSELEEIVIRRNLIGKKKCFIKTNRSEIKFSKTTTDLGVLKRQLEASTHEKTNEGAISSQGFFESSWLADRYHEKIRILLKLTPGDTGRWKTVL